MRLVDSSDPDAVPRDEANRLLAEATVLATTLCRELLAASNVVDHRPRAAARLFHAWEQSPEGRRFYELRETGQLQHRTTSTSQLRDLEATVPVISTYMLLLTADNIDFRRDQEDLARKLDQWRKRTEIDSF